MLIPHKLILPMCFMVVYSCVRLRVASASFLRHLGNRLPSRGQHAGGSGNARGFQHQAGGSRRESSRDAAIVSSRRRPGGRPTGSEQGAQRSRLWSPSDLMLYMQSPFAAWMERVARECPEHPWLAKAGDLSLLAQQNPMLAMLSEKGQAAERRFLDREFLGNPARYPDVADLSGDGNDGKRKFRYGDATPTLEAMRRGADVIFQAPLVGAGGFAGVADFLVKRPFVVDGDGGGGGGGGGYYYEVWDAKFGKHAAPQHMLQLWCYTEIVCGLAGCVFGGGTSYY